MTAVSSSLGAHHICHVQRQHTNKIHLKQIRTTSRTTTTTSTTTTTTATTKYEERYKKKMLR